MSKIFEISGDSTQKSTSCPVENNQKSSLTEENDTKVIHKDSFSESYANAGVDITAGYKAVELMKKSIARTKVEGSIDNIGNFGGLFLPNLSGMTKPVFVSGTDGVGTKLKIAMLLDKHNTIGIDCVAMCVNDIVCCGAKPLFFLDYIACGKNYPAKIASIVEGIAEGCVQAGCALIGGETAEHPGMMPADEYDVAGFTVGVVDYDKILQPDSQKTGDILIGLPSNGVHSNGFSLVRKIFNVDEASLSNYYCELGRTLGEELLEPTVIYVKPILELFKNVPVKAIAHITGGGFYENIPRILPKNLTAKIEEKSFETPPIFNLIQKTGDISEREMYNIFNMGIGMVVSVSSEYADEAIRSLQESGINACDIGELVPGDGSLYLW